MIKLNKTDQEILVVLKETFLARCRSPLESDDNLRVWIIRCLFFVTLLALLSSAVASVRGLEFPSEASSTPATMFFGLLFIHINNEIEDTSVLVFLLTWVSIVVALYV